MDRPATAADTFQETTIEVTETAEQPVVAKQTRVVEEVVIGKTAEEREEVKSLVVQSAVSSARNGSRSPPRRATPAPRSTDR